MLSPMRWTLAAVVTCAVTAALGLPRDIAQAPSFPQRESIPDWVAPALAKSALDKTLAIDTRLNPFYQRGDFDGDGALDFAALVVETTSKKSGIVIVHRATTRAFVVGAGRTIGNGGDDFSWMDAWRVFEKSAVPRSTGAPPVLKGDALHVIKTESASGLIYWTGTAYRWYQQGD